VSFSVDGWPRRFKSFGRQALTRTCWGMGFPRPRSLFIIQPVRFRADLPHLRTPNKSLRVTRLELKRKQSHTAKVVQRRERRLGRTGRSLKGAGLRLAQVGLLLGALSQAAPGSCCVAASHCRGQAGHRCAYSGCRAGTRARPTARVAPGSSSPSPLGLGPHPANGPPFLLSLTPGVPPPSPVPPPLEGASRRARRAVMAGCGRCRKPRAIASGLR